jgi:carboxymethylenebutenolidase
MGEWLTVGPEDSRAYLALPERRRGSGVLVLHAWWGLTPVFTDVCDRLAANGFVALAPSLYPHGETADTIPAAEALISAHDAEPDAARRIAVAAVERLRDMPEVTGDGIGAFGFSMGAWWALQLSLERPDDIAAAVSIYSVNDGDYGPARAAYQVHLAEFDDYEPEEYVTAMKAAVNAAGRDAEFHVYPGAKHWFVEPNRADVYDAAAAELVWERSLAFLHERLD